MKQSKERFLRQDARGAPVTVGKLFSLSFLICRMGLMFVVWKS